MKQGIVLAFSCFAAICPAFAAGPYDGTWSVMISCDTAPDGARGYVWRFEAEVANNRVSGHYNQGAAEATGTLTGTIQPNGSAMLSVRGRTGRPEYSLKAVKPGSPISYTLSTQFSGQTASGQRNEARPCTIAMAKHQR